MGALGLAENNLRRLNTCALWPSAEVAVAWHSCDARVGEEAEETRERDRGMGKNGDNRGKQRQRGGLGAQRGMTADGGACDVVGCMIVKRVHHVIP